MPGLTLPRLTLPRLATVLAAGALGLAAFSGPASADTLTLHVRPGDGPLFVQHAWHLRDNPNVTPSNPMGVVGWDGPPDDVPSVIGDAGPMPPGSIANAPYAGYGYGWY